MILYIYDKVWDYNKRENKRKFRTINNVIESERINII